MDDPLEAYSYDRAVYAFGSSLTTALENAQGKNKKETERKQQSVFRKWLPDAPISKKFADPSATGKAIKRQGE